MLIHHRRDQEKREIFWKAHEIADPSERAAYLQGECGQDHALRSSVESLLKNHTDNDFPGDFAEHPRPFSPIGEKEGDMIGRYKLSKKLGEGTFGAVWKVNQSGNDGKELALKVILPGMDTAEVLRRFETERKTLARLDQHPNIVTIFEGGTTDTGRPYFVMGLVRDGEDITDYASHHNLSIQDRLGLFLKVCRAIQHAHQNNVVHRDIKPSNILVTKLPGEHLAKVIDFGISKILIRDDKSNEKSTTRPGELLGTLAYMSPEQAEGKVEVDSRADIYSLGALLYKLLTDCVPLDLDGLSRYEKLKTIIEEKPKKPSEKYNGLSEETRRTFSQSCQAVSVTLQALLEEHLDPIVMKCLQKDRDRRFSTADELIASINRLQEFLKAQASEEVPDPNPTPLKIVKAIVKPFWTADSLWYSDWERREIAGSKWYKTFPGISGKMMILLFPANSIYKFCKRDVVGGVVFLFGTIILAYIAVLVRKFRSSPDDDLITPETLHSNSTDSAADVKLGWKVNLAIIVAIPVTFAWFLGPCYCYLTINLWLLFYCLRLPLWCWAFLMSGVVSENESVAPSR